jgi:hypothetical protein
VQDRTERKDRAGTNVAHNELEASMKNQEPNPASAKDLAEGSSENVNAGAKSVKGGANDFKPKNDLDGKTDSGPEPDVFGREIPPQD